MYFEEKDVGNPYREDYLETLYDLIEKRQRFANDARSLHFRQMIGRQNAYRAELCDMFGWPLTEKIHEVPTGTKTFVAEDEGVRIYRVRLEMLGGLKFYGVLFERDAPESLPLAIVQHGGSGTPELCGGLYRSGSGNYNDMVRRTLRCGANVFAPQLLLWNCEQYGIPYNRIEIDGKLKQLGSSITAVEIYALSRSLDYLTKQGYGADGRIGMVGLSYGGFYALATAAVDTRIRATVACSHYNDRFRYAWTDWTWRDSGFRFLDNEMAMLVYPRYLCLEIGDRDAAFASDSGRATFEELGRMTSGDDSWLDFRVFDGVHEFYQQDDDLKKMIDRLNAFGKTPVKKRK